MIKQQLVLRGWQIFVTVMLAMISQSAMAATYTYTAPGAGATTAWAAGTNWTGAVAPTSAVTTTLVFGGSPTATVTTTDDIAGPFLLNALTLSGANGSNFSTRTYTIAAGGVGSPSFTFSVDGITAPTINLSSNNTGLGTNITYNVGINGAIDGGSLVIQGNGSATFNYTGILSDGSSSATLTKNGTSTLTLAGANTYTGGTILNAGGLSLNNAAALGNGGALTINGGSLNNTSGSSVTLNTHAENWNADFVFGGNAYNTTSALNLGTGNVTLGGSRTLTVNGATNGSAALTVGGVIDDGINTYGLTMAGSATSGTGTLILTNTNTYGGPTTINAGVLQIAALGSLGGSGADVTVNEGGTLSTAYALDATTLARITAGSTGTLAMAGVTSSTNLDFTGLNTTLGASGSTASTYSGTLTPNGSTYRVGGGYGTLNFNSLLSGSRNLVVGGGGTPGTVNLGVAGTYNGGTTVTGGLGTSSSVLQTNLTGTTTPFGSGAISLNNGVLGFGTGPTALTSGQSMAATIGAVNFQGQNEIKLAKGASTQPLPVSVTIDSLNRTNGVLFITPSAGANLGVSEKVFITNSGSISLTPVNGMISGAVIDGTNKTFLTYGANGLVDATTTGTYGSNNIVGLTADPGTAVRAYALRTTATTSANDNFIVGAGGFIANTGMNNAAGNLSFGSTHALLGFFGSSNDGNGLAINTTGGATFYGVGTRLLISNLNISGGINFAGGTWVLNTQPTGNEMFQTTNPNALTISRGATVTNSQGAKLTGASLSGDGLLTSNSTDGSAFQVTINGLNDTGTSTFTGGITDVFQSTLNIIKTGLNTQVFSGVNTYRGGTTVNGGTLKGTQTSGTPFGTGNITLAGGALSIAPSGSGANVALTGANTAIGSTFTFGANSQLNLDKGSNTSLSYTVGNTGAAANSVLVRSANGTLILAPASGIANLGTASGEKFIVNGGVTTTNGIVSAAIIGQDNDSNKSGTFLGYNGVNGLVGGTYTDTNFAAASSSSVEDVTAATAVNTQTIYALRASDALTLNAGQTLTIGNGSLPAGVILNGGSISGGTALAFGAAPAVVYSSLANGTIGSVITGSGGVSVMGPGTTTFSGTNTYTTATSVNDSTLSITNNANLGNTANALNLNGGTLKSSGAVALGARGINLANGRSSLGGTFDVTGTATSTGVIAGTGSLYKTGTGDLKISGTNTFTGFTTVSGGTLTLANSLALQSSTLLSGGIVFDSSVGSHAFSVGGLSGNFNLNLEDNAGSPNAVALSVGNTSTIGTTHTGVLSGSGSLLKINTGNLTLGGANTYTGQTKIQAGTLTVASLNSVVGGTSSSSLGAPITVGNGTIGIGATTVAGTLSYTGSGETTDRVIDLAGTTGGATISANGTGALVFSSNLTATGVGAKTLTLSGSSESNVDNSIQGAIVDSSSGATSVTKSGVNTWVLAGNNSYTGATVVGTTGTLKLGSAGSGGNGPLGTVAAGTTVNSGGTLDLNGFTLTNAEALTLNGNGVSNGTSTAGALINSSATGAGYSGLVTLGAASKIVANGNINLTNTGTITGATFGLTLDGTSIGSGIASIIGTTSGGLTKQGTGTWTLSGANTYTGTTTVNAGTLVLDKTGAGALASTSALTLGGGTFQVKAAASGATTQTLGALTLTANTNSVISLDPNGGTGVTLTLGNAWTRGAGSSLLFDYSSANSGTRTVATAGATTGATLSNGIYGWGLVKDSAGVTGFATRDGSGNISRYDDTTGTTLVNNSNVAATNFTTLNTVYTSGILSWNSGITTRSVNSLTIDTTNSGGTIDMGVASNILTLTSSGILFKGGNNEILTGGQVGAAASEVIIHQTGTGLLTINSLISSGAGSLTKDGTGTLVVGGANTYTGATTINAGTLRLGSAGGGTNTPLGTVGAGTTVNDGGALDVNGFTLGTAEALTLRGTGVSNGGALTNSSATAATYSGLVTLGANASIVSSNGNINLSNTGTITGNGFGLTLGGTATGSSIASVIGTGNGGLTKTGTGTWNLTGVNTYTGATTVSGGTLLVNGSINNSTVTVATGGTLGGSGSSGAVIVQSGGTLAPGNSPGVSTSASLTLYGGANYALQLMSDGTGVAGTDWDSYVATGALDISALSSGSTFVFKLETLANVTTAGLLGSWDGSVNHTWANVIDYGSLTGTYASNLFTVDTTNFANTFTGTFSIVQNGTALDLQYIAAVPEPSTYAMVGLGLLSLWALRRKKAKIA